MKSMNRNLPNNRPAWFNLRITIAALALIILPTYVSADGLVMPPIAYKGSLNETAQEAILIFHKGTEDEPSSQDMILKISVQGEASDFGWVVPLPGVPETGKADAAMFKELHDYVQARMPRTKGKKEARSGGIDNLAEPQATPDVEVVKREVVGSYDVAIVREHKAGALLDWLKENKFQAPDGIGDVIEFYRSKKYVFACMKVTDAELKRTMPADLHPIRFTFSTGGQDGIFFPMRMTGLQEAPFDLNLYILYDKWINDELSRYGFTRRGLQLRWRDYDSRTCTPNAGKWWARPDKDRYLSGYARLFPTVTSYMAEHHPDNRYYLTNIYARQLDPEEVLDWKDDLWVFPYYTNKRFVPFDARKGGPAALGY